MTHQTGNLSSTERTISAIAGAVLSLLAARRGNPAIRAAAGAVSAALLARAYAGHCAMKAAMTGQTSIADGVADQWKRMSGGRDTEAAARPGSTAHTIQLDAIDESVGESFPASDPPASRIPDVPPISAEASWAAARCGDGSGAFT